MIAICWLMQEALLRGLERDIAAARGLDFKSPVEARVIERPQDADAKLQGYYSLRDKTLYLYDDLRGEYERGVLIHEMVHALQDQHFGLARLHEAAGSDAELAASALIEGDATLTMIELVPRAAAMLDVPVHASRDRRRAFLYAQGARYVRALKERGGWEAVNAAYRNPPRTTAQVLHPEGVKPVTVGFGPSRGEFAILDMYPKTPEAAAGWRGDSFNETAGGSWWAVAFETENDALEFQRAAVEAGDAFLDEAGARAWTREDGTIGASIARGDRAYVLSAADEPAFRSLLDRIDGSVASFRVWASAEQRFITFGEMLDRLQAYALVCVGETHDSEPHHLVQLQVIRGLYAYDESVGVGMEMFQRPFQEAIDRYLAGAGDEAAFLRETEYEKRWGFDWRLYRPIVEFCRRNGLPLAALNAPRELTGRISKVGFDALTDEEKAQLGPIDFRVKPHRDYWYDRLSNMHGARTPSEEQKERSYQVMTAWDHVMGTTAAAFRRERGLRRLVVLAGSGHVDRGIGIAARSGEKAATVHVAGDFDPGRDEAPADFVVVP